MLISVSTHWLHSIRKTHEPLCLSFLSCGRTCCLIQGLPQGHSVRTQEIRKAGEPWGPRFSMQIICWSHWGSFKECWCPHLPPHDPWPVRPEPQASDALRCLEPLLEKEGQITLLPWKNPIRFRDFFLIPFGRPGISLRMTGCWRDIQHIPSKQVLSAPRHSLWKLSRAFIYLNLLSSTLWSLVVKCNQTWIYKSAKHVLGLQMNYWEESPFHLTGFLWWP